MTQSDIEALHLDSVDSVSIALLVERIGPLSGSRMQEICSALEVATVAEFPSLSWLHADRAKALRGLAELVADVVTDLEANREPVPEPIGERRFSGTFNVGVPESLHRQRARRRRGAGQSETARACLSDTTGEHIGQVLREAGWNPQSLVCSSPNTV